MGYTNRRDTMKWWDPHTKKLKYCSSKKFDEHKNKFVTGWSPGSELMTGTNIPTLPTLKIDLLDHPLIKYDIFEVNGGAPDGIIAQYCEHHNMSYISQSAENIPQNHAFTARKTTSLWIFRIGIKEPATVKKVLEDISSQQITGKFNRVHVNTPHIYKNIFRTNLQKNRYIFNQIRHIQVIENKIISIT